MKILVDAFGGDNAPLETIKGSIKAAEELGVEVVLVGDEKKIKDCAEENSLSLEKLSIAQADDIMEVCEEPTKILNEMKNSSMAVGLKMLADGEGDAFLSAGSTGALVVGATFIVKRLRGVKRAALATILPTRGKPVLMLDVGANAECRPEMLVQFAVMGSAYMNKVLGVSNPSVALANIGAEETKGRETEVSAYQLLKSAPVNFIGNIEARNIPLGETDVVVADGFSGNLMLKLYEGMGKFFASELKNMLLDGVLSKIGAVFLLKKIKAFKKKMDYSEYGGAPLLGTSKPVFKAHGSSDAKAFYNAIRQAKTFAENRVIDEIADGLKTIKEQQAEK